MQPSTLTNTIIWKVWIPWSQRISSFIVIIFCSNHSDRTARWNIYFLPKYHIFINQFLFLFLLLRISLLFLLWYCWKILMGVNIWIVLFIAAFKAKFVTILRKVFNFIENDCIWILEFIKWIFVNIFAWDESLGNLVTVGRAILVLKNVLFNHQFFLFTSCFLLYLILMFLNFFIFINVFKLKQKILIL